MEKCELSNAEISRYSRQLILPHFGVTGQLKLRASRVLIVGCGGLGCPAAIYLAAAGVGTIGLVDDDVVELNNLHRQIGHSETAVGKSKVSSLAQHCRQLNSAVLIEEHPVHFQSSNAIEIVERYDVVVDCSDNLATRYLINDACAVSGPKPLVSGSALRLEGQMTVYLANRLRSPEEVQNGVPLPPDARALCFRCLFPTPSPADTTQRCSEAGVLGVVPGIIGTMQAAEVVKIITGIGDVHSGRLFILDMERNLTRTVKLRPPLPDCPVCSDKAPLNPGAVKLTDYVQFCGAPDGDKTPAVNTKSLRNRITVQELHALLSSGSPYLMIDIRTTAEYELCRLVPCLHIPMKELLRDDAISVIQSALNEKLKQFPQRPLPIVLICHRGNQSEVAASQLASALLCARRCNSHTNLESMDVDPPPESADFVICDVGGGLAAWAAEINPDFPTY
ncbi:unnamed protein product [Calicophoron daubneyi]|uniref:Adenylyltransferase and sulfurtransferase MOCS3 homolog n=1 Tax=Calicophoron daubneyi TaxID=300641 RepID=A0AAV2TCC7_CALDB